MISALCKCQAKDPPPLLFSKAKADKINDDSFRSETYFKINNKNNRIKARNQQLLVVFCNCKFCFDNCDFKCSRQFDARLLFFFFSENFVLKTSVQWSQKICYGLTWEISHSWDVHRDDSFSLKLNNIFLKFSHEKF